MSKKGGGQAKGGAQAKTANTTTKSGGKGNQKGGNTKATTTAEPKEEKVKSANQAKCRHILCEKQGKINDALAALESGTSFDQVAREFSEDKARDGGNLGWLTRQQMCGEFQNRAFIIPLNQYVGPFKSQHGYHILLVEARKV